MVSGRHMVAVVVAVLWPAIASAQLSVLRSGGFAAPYQELVPAFEKVSGISVMSRQAASQGSGPNTIPALLRSGTTADVVIMSNEGLEELIAEGRVVEGSTVALAQSALGVAVRKGALKPNLSSVAGFREAVLRAKSINMVSTTGIYAREKLFPMLGIKEDAARKSNADGLADLAKGTSDLVLRPVSEIVNLPGFDYVGPVPREIQFVSVFSAAIVRGSRQVEAARRLITFLSTEEAGAVARRHGMESVRGK